MESNQIWCFCNWQVPPHPHSPLLPMLAPSWLRALLCSPQAAREASARSAFAAAPVLQWLHFCLDCDPSFQIVGGPWLESGWGSVWTFHKSVTQQRKQWTSEGSWLLLLTRNPPPAMISSEDHGDKPQKFCSHHSRQTPNTNEWNVLWHFVFKPILLERHKYGC